VVPDIAAATSDLSGFLFSDFRRFRPMPRSPAQQRFAEIVRRSDEKLDLAEAALALAQTEYPDLDPSAYIARLAELAEQGRTAAGDVEPAEKARRLAKFLFCDLGFSGNEKEYYDPRNSYLNEVLDRKLGLPITLSVLYLDVASRLALPVYGVGLPAHFVVKFQDGPEEMFIDPFHGGAILTEAECCAVVSGVFRRPVKPSPAFFARVGPRQIVRRMLANLRNVYLSRQDLTRGIRTIETLLILDPESADDVRDLGVLYFHAGRPGESLVCFERYLDLAPNAEDAAQIEKNIAAIRRKMDEGKPGT
jgi:regulator of sirC expression with transglutaminase-like and TPR domain